MASKSIKLQIMFIDWFYQLIIKMAIQLIIATNDQIYKARFVTQSNAVLNKTDLLQFTEKCFKNFMYLFFIFF